MSYLVLGFIPERSSRIAELPITPLSEPSGVHTPLRQDGHYGDAESALGVAELWRQNPIHPRERVLVVEIVDEPPSANRPGVRLTDFSPT